MCGIIGAIGHDNITNVLTTGLSRLEYRGYDSAGIAVIDDSENIRVKKCLGKVKDLLYLLQQDSITGSTGIAHTRWATHGAPSTINAHPHVCMDEIAIVHNGIIENYNPLRQQLIERGYQFQSETDTEVIVKQVHFSLTKDADPLIAVNNTLKMLEGSYAIGLIFKDHPERIIAARHGSPLIIGIGENQYFIASDIFALLPFTRKYIVLEEGDIADVDLNDGLRIYNTDLSIVERRQQYTELPHEEVAKSGFRHYMLSEIFQQPEAIENTLKLNISGEKFLISEQDNQDVLKKLKAVHIVACGTSYHAGLVARHWFETVAGIPCTVDIASEYRYFDSYIAPDTLFVVISQSGETADTLAALQKAKSREYLATLGICNVPESSLTRETDLTMMTVAGIEIGVASTKAFTTQLLNLLTLTLAIAHAKQSRNVKSVEWLSQLHKIPEHMRKILMLDDNIQAIAERFVSKDHALYLGRGIMLPIAMEGALKLKEVSYIHAEAYAAGELKHGPLALVDNNMPVIAVAPNNQLLTKLVSNLQEVHARGGELFVFADSMVDLDRFDNAHKLRLDVENNFLAPIYYAIPMQLLAYHVAVLKGADVDQPRNLAKSVTVE
jgi:glutamine---fructose-6-phosphate transaminase (isomerizing)